MKAINFINWKYIGLAGDRERIVHLQFLFSGKFRSGADIQCQSELVYRIG